MGFDEFDKYDTGRSNNEPGKLAVFLIRHIKVVAIVIIIGICAMVYIINQAKVDKIARIKEESISYARNKSEEICQEYGMTDSIIVVNDVRNYDSKTIYIGTISVDSDKFMSLSAQDAFKVMQKFNGISYRSGDIDVGFVIHMSSNGHDFRYKTENSGDYVYAYVMRDYEGSAITGRISLTGSNWNVIWSDTDYFR